MILDKKFLLMISVFVIGSSLVACAGGLVDGRNATLNSLEKVDDYPLYTMHYAGAYEAVGEYPSPDQPSGIGIGNSANMRLPAPSWACSLFVTLGSDDNLLYGRNFDWDYSPALLLYTDPPDGYASVSMVDLAYFGFRQEELTNLTNLPINERRALLETPFYPFDGMNEYGLVVGMAAVPPGMMVPDPAKETIGSLGIIREMLDHARDTDEAVAILQSYNINFEGGPPIHYLIADGLGEAVLVEFYQGKMVIIPAESDWHQATNFLVASTGETTSGHCWRYDQIEGRLSISRGRLTSGEAMELLAEVSQPTTQWSVVYRMSAREVAVVMGQNYERQHIFPLTDTNK